MELNSGSVTYLASLTLVTEQERLTESPNTPATSPPRLSGDRQSNTPHTLSTTYLEGRQCHA